MILTDKFVFVANPRTASRSIEALLCCVLGREAQVTELHHPKTNHPALKRDVPIYGVVRDPYDWIVSWFHHCKKKKEDFPRFVKYYENGWLYKDRLAIYSPYITQAFPLTKGVSAIVAEIVGKERWARFVSESPFAKEPRIGSTGPEPSLWTPGLRKVAQQRFPADFIAWEQLNSYEH